MSRRYHKPPGRRRAAACAPEALEPRVLLATYTVTTTADSGAGSLRQAILSANANASAGDTIRFNIPTSAGAVATILPATPLPHVTDRVDIDATTQPGYTPGRPVVQITGMSGTLRMGLYLLNASNSRIRGLILNRWSGAGIYLAGGTGIVIESNWIGLNANGTAADGNGVGVAAVTATGARIGGNTAAQRNVISGNSGAGTGIGINLDGNDHVVTGNYIGTNPAGTAAVGNTVGIRVKGDGNRIGGSIVGEGNVISGNVTGVHVGTESGGATPDYATANVVAGNSIGTSADGSAPVANTASGVLVGGGASDTLIGGASFGEGNLISGNATGVTTYVAVSFGSNVPPPRNTRIEGNTIGLSSSGERLPNTTGVHLRSGNAVVGGASGAGNVIAGNGVGVKVNANEGRIEGNRIGVRGDNGDVPVPNTVGVLIESGWGVTVGGTAPGAGNVISANRDAGVRISAGGLGPPVGSPQLGHRIQGNFIGLEADGDDVVGGGTGVHLESARGVLVGGDAAGARNVISGNSDGVRMHNARDSVVEGNYIGTSRSGADRRTGNTMFGVTGSGPDLQGNVIRGNLIAYNYADGVALTGGRGNAILTNSIHSNGGLGINLGTDGVTPNDAADADTGPNELQNFPVITSVLHDGTRLLVRGTIDGTGATNSYRVQFFASPAADPSGHGEGATFVGEETIAVGSTGAAPFAVALPAALPAVQEGHYLTATATGRTSTGGTVPVQTSEFSPAVAVPRPDTEAPRVAGVWVNSTSWADAFRQRLQATGAGSRTHGYAIPGGARQFDALPWTNLNQVTIAFTEPVDVRHDDLILRTRTGTLAASQFATTGTTATWRLGAPIRMQEVRLELRSGGAAGVKDAVGRGLDGDWVNGAQAFPSGNGTPGPDFLFVFNVLPGGVNGDRAVNAWDYLKVRAAYNTAVGADGQAPRRYSVYADVNGDGYVNAIDLLTVRRNLREALPA